MKIRKMVKKTMAAGILALMACASMSAMAEKQFVWAGEVCDTNACVFKGFDAVCREAVRVRNAIGGSAWPVTYLGSWTITGDYSLRCAADNKLDKRDFVATSFRCSRYLSFFSMDRPDGCYEYIDCDPSLYARQAMPEACKPEIEIDPCDNNVPEDPNVIGWVACWQDESGKTLTKICERPERIEAKDPTAHSIIRACNRVHEGIHENDDSGDATCSSTKGRIDPTSEAGWHRGEHKAFTAELECLNKPSSNDMQCIIHNPDDKVAQEACKKDLFDRRSFVRGMIAEHAQ